MAKNYDIYYCVYVQKDGWQTWKKNGEKAGTSGRGLRLEAIQIKLVKKGVPPSIITLDGKGFRTIHSMENAKQMVGAGPYLIISQRFHNERALYLAKKVGLDAIAFNADNTTSKRWRIQMRIREALARVKAVFE